MCMADSLSGYTMHCRLCHNPQVELLHFGARLSRNQRSRRSSLMADAAQDDTRFPKQDSVLAKKSQSFPCYSHSHEHTHTGVT